MERLKRIRINSPRREERVKFLSDSDSEISLNDTDNDKNTGNKNMSKTDSIDYVFDNDDEKCTTKATFSKQSFVIEKSPIDNNSEKSKEPRMFYNNVQDNQNDKKQTVKTEKALKTSDTVKTKKTKNELFIEDAFAPELSSRARPSSAILRKKLDKNDAECSPRINLPVFPKAPKVVQKTSFTRVGGGWMKTEDYLRNHVPIRVYEYKRPVSGNSFLYLKSKFVSEKDNISVIYKSRDRLLQSPRYHIPMAINDKESWNKYDTFIPGR